MSGWEMRGHEHVVVRGSKNLLRLRALARHLHVERARFSSLLTFSCVK